MHRHLSRPLGAGGFSGHLILGAWARVDPGPGVPARGQHEGLARLWREMKPGSGYCPMVTITTSDPQETYNYRSGVGAEWPFPADPGASSSATSISPSTPDPAHNQMVPHTIVCEPGLIIIYKIYNGYGA